MPIYTLSKLQQDYSMYRNRDISSSTKNVPFINFYLCPWKRHILKKEVSERPVEYGVYTEEVVHITFIACGKCCKENGLYLEPQNISQHRELKVIIKYMELDNTLNSLIYNTAIKRCVELYHILFRDGREFYHPISRSMIYNIRQHDESLSSIDI